MSYTPFVDKTTFEIIYRDYQPSDSEQCIALEEEASQTPTLFGLLKAGTIFGEEYDIKTKKFNESIIIVAEAIDKEDNTRKRICACACVGIKNMYFNQQIVKAGVIFALRVSEKFQKQGIGLKLTTLLEETAIKKNCEFFYLSVNGNNAKAIGLYKKCGYDTISKRRLQRFGITKMPLEDRNNQEITYTSNMERKLIFEKLDDDQAKEYYDKFYTGKDLAIADVNEIHRLSGYVGTFAVKTEDQKNVVGISLLKSGISGGMGLKKAIFPAHYFALDGFITFWIACWLLVPFYLITTFGGNLSSLTKTALFFLSSWPLIWVYQKANGFIQTFSGFKPRGRYIGPFYELQEEGLHKPMLDFLMKRMNKVSSDNNIEFVLCNMDSNDKLFGSSGRKFGPKPPLFMGKYIQDKNRLVRKNGNESSSDVMFFDPRDM